MRAEINRFMMVHCICIVLTMYSACLRAQSVFDDEQTQFSAEDLAVKRPVNLPGEIIDFLKHDDLVGRVLRARSIDSDHIPPSWFSASVIHLSGPQEKDIIVMTSPEFPAGNIAPFWIFKPQGASYRLILKTAAHDLAILKRRDMGYREVEIESMTVDTQSKLRYRFDGREYVAISTNHHTR